MNIKLCSNRFKLQSYCVLFKILDDGGFGVGMDLALKSHTQHGLNTFMYEFDYRSQQNDNPEWIGKYNGMLDYRVTNHIYLLKLRKQVKTTFVNQIFLWHRFISDLGAICIQSYREF